MDIVMLFSPEERDRSIALWQRHIRPNLGARECNQFVKATKKPLNWFVDTIIKPSLFLPGHDGGIYYPVDLTALSDGRNHRLAQRIAEEPDHHAVFGGNPFNGLVYFANPLRLDLPVWDEVRQKEVYARPKDRVVLGRHQVFTFEFDVPTVAFLKVQLSWLRSSDNWRNCAMGRLFAHCSGFADFVGITVNYSGHKSLHIHIVFDTDLARERLALGARVAVREGLIAHWERLHTEVLRILDVTAGVDADWHLKFPESFRRLPNGSRVIDQAGHILGFPVGTHVPQITLWEKWRERASRDDLPLFFCPEPFQPDPTVLKPLRMYNPTVRSGANLTNEERVYCEDRLREIYADWPRFDHLTFEGDRWVAKFRNSPDDRNPSSMMREDFASIHLMGRGAAGLQPKALKFPLGTMLRLWVGRLRAAKDFEHPACIQDILFGPAPQNISTPLEQDFRQNVVDGKTALNAMRSFLRHTVSRHPLLLIVGPEGLGKTSVLMALHHEFVADLERRGESGLAMYAFADYDAAESKCAAFNEAQGHHGFVGVVLPSFSRAYEDACTKLGIKQISVEEAAKLRFPSRWAAVEKHQPTVISALRDRHTAMWASVGTKKPVFFTVHQVAHHWKKSGNTRLMWAQSFWQGSMDDGAHKEICRVETTLGLLVHDEVKVDSIVDMQPEAVCRWIDELVRSEPKVWSTDRLDLSKALVSYERWVAAHGHPQVGEREARVPFEEAVRLSQVPLSRWDHVMTADTGEYIQKANNEPAADPGEADHCDIYAARHGRSWMIDSRGWWDGVANNVIVLTTEAVPTAVIRRADPAWSIFELETPNVPRDSVETYASRSVTGQNLPKICSEWLDRYPDDNLFIVSNKVGMMTETMPHVTARGSNDLIGRNVLSTMTFMTPDEYEKLQALNAWTGRSDLVGLRHIDEFNQTAGRNLGYRKQGDVKHVLLVNRRLFGLLMGGGEPLKRSRYDFRLHMDKHQRYEIKTGGLSPPQKPLH